MTKPTCRTLGSITYLGPLLLSILPVLTAPAAPRPPPPPRLPPPRCSHQSPASEMLRQLRNPIPGLETDDPHAEFGDVEGQSGQI